jgi:hypothetical protein
MSNGLRRIKRRIAERNRVDWWQVMRAKRQWLVGRRRGMTSELAREFGRYW